MVRTREVDVGGKKGSIYILLKRRRERPGLSPEKGTGEAVKGGKKKRCLSGGGEKGVAHTYSDPGRGETSFSIVKKEGVGF